LANTFIYLFVFVYLFSFIQNLFVGIVSHSPCFRELLVLLRPEGASFCKLAFPPVGWQRPAEQPAHRTTVCAQLQTVGILWQPRHFPSVEQEWGLCTGRCFLCFLFSSSRDRCRRSFARAMFSWVGRQPPKRWPVLSGL